jgi:hypothetical protein
VGLVSIAIEITQRSKKRGQGTRRSWSGQEISGKWTENAKRIGGSGIDEAVEPPAATLRDVREGNSLVLDLEEKHVSASHSE